MAHTEEMLINGVMTPVVKFDHSAQEIDDAVDKANNAVSKSGDTMTGTLILKPSGAAGYGQLYKNATEGFDYGTLFCDRSANGGLMGLKLDAARSLARITNGSAEYNIYHTGNKPSGSYTGNGDATSRTLEIGALGRVVAIWSNNGSVLIVNAVGFGRANDGLKEISGGNVFVGSTGNLVLSTTNVLLNASGVTYNYQVL